MAYLIDTDILSYVIHGIPEAEALLDELADEGIAMSAITYLEALQSVTRSPIPGTARQRFDGLLSEMPVIYFGLLRLNEPQTCSSSSDRTGSVCARGRSISSSPALP